MEYLWQGSAWFLGVIAVTYLIFIDYKLMSIRDELASLSHSLIGNYKKDFLMEKRMEKNFEDFPKPRVVRSREIEEEENARKMDGASV